jgi:hypothetical protein
MNINQRLSIIQSVQAPSRYSNASGPYTVSVHRQEATNLFKAMNVESLPGLPHCPRPLNGMCGFCKIKAMQVSVLNPFKRKETFIECMNSEIAKLPSKPKTNINRTTRVDQTSATNLIAQGAPTNANLQEYQAPEAPAVPSKKTMIYVVIGAAVLIGAFIMLKK